jgi:flagellar protein FliO/FliZ
MRLAACLTCVVFCDVAAAAATAGDGTVADTVAAVDFSNMLMSLVLVVAFILLTAFAVKRLPFGFAGKNSGPLKVVATLALGPKERLLLVDARGTEVLIAVSPAGLSIVNAARDLRSSDPEFELSGGAERGHGESERAFSLEANP